MPRESIIETNVRTVAEMLSFCPAFQEICGIDPVGTEAAQLEARKHTKESNVLYFDGEGAAANENVPESEKLIPRKRKTRDDWIAQRPLATVMHNTEAFEFETKAVGVFLPTGIITVVVEKNVVGPDGQPIADSEMPSEQAANDWISLISNLKEELFIISCQNRIPLTKTVYPGNYLWLKRSILSIPPQFSGLEDNRTYGPHFIAAIHLHYGPKN